MGDICKVENCDLPVYSKKNSVCRNHYHRLKTYGDPLGGTFYAKNERCTIDDCPKPAKASDMCAMHYARSHRTGDPRVRTLQKFRADEILEWFYSHKDYDGDDCLTGPVAKPARYTQMYVNKKNYLGHRFMCEIAHGPPDEVNNMALHSCGKGHLGCLNPKHLRWGTHMDNMRDKAEHFQRDKRAASKLGLTVKEYREGKR